MLVLLCRCLMSPNNRLIYVHRLSDFIYINPQQNLIQSLIVNSDISCLCLFILSHSQKKTETTLRSAILYKAFASLVISNFLETENNRLYWKRSHFCSYIINHRLSDTTGSQHQRFIEYNLGIIKLASANQLPRPSLRTIFLV